MHDVCTMDKVCEVCCNRHVYSISSKNVMHMHILSKTGHYLWLGLKRKSLTVSKIFYKPKLLLTLFFVQITVKKNHLHVELTENFWYLTDSPSVQTTEINNND